MGIGANACRDDETGYTDIRKRGEHQVRGQLSTSPNVSPVVMVERTLVCIQTGKYIDGAEGLTAQRPSAHHSHHRQNAFLPRTTLRRRVPPSGQSSPYKYTKTCHIHHPRKNSGLISTGLGGSLMSRTFLTSLTPSPMRERQPMATAPHLQSRGPHT